MEGQWSDLLAELFRVRIASGKTCILREMESDRNFPDFLATLAVFLCRSCFINEPKTVFGVNTQSP